MSECLFKKTVNMILEKGIKKQTQIFEEKKLINLFHFSAISYLISHPSAETPTFQ